MGGDGLRDRRRGWEGAGGEGRKRDGRRGWEEGQVERVGRGTGGEGGKREGRGDLLPHFLSASLHLHSSSA